MRRTGADSLEDLTSELENFEKNKNEHMFPELTPQRHVVRQHPCFSKCLFITFFSSGSCKPQEQCSLCNSFIKRITHRPAGCKHTRASRMRPASRPSHQERTEALAPGIDKGHLP